MIPFYSYALQYDLVVALQAVGFDGHGITGIEGLSGIGYGDIGHKSGLFLFVVITASGK